MSYFINSTHPRGLSFYIISFLSLLAFSVSVSAQDFHWAGVGFMGDYAKRDTLYPYSSRVFDDHSCDNTSCFEVFSRTVFKGQKIAGGKVKFTQAEPGTNAIGVALAITYERLIVDETVNSHYTNKNTLNSIAIFGSLLFMDLDSNKLVGAVPTYIRYDTASNGKISDKEMYGIVKAMLVSNELKINFASDALSRAKKYSLPSDKVRRAQIVEVSSSTKVNDVIGYSKDAMNYFTMQLAQVFEGVLMTETGIQMLPSSVGHIVGGKLKTRLSSGNRVIELPEPDVAIKLNLAKLGKLQKEKANGSGNTVCHAARLNFSVEDSFGDSILDLPLKSMPCRFYRKGTQINDQTQYEKTLLALLSNIAKALNMPDDSDDFYKKSSKNQNQTKEAFSMFMKNF
ncbi:conserved hypothetical protein [Bathymodiolus platifrons methanotrophic gill symbiont]|uniref:hypothetical protein n=1 Tax=unclassified Gammaproteobacteria TaxID=33811 RepID=UPI000B4234F8|nr:MULTISPECIES: hypothetical protein [unclassified Gammaproteobacteria]TXK95120.1 hypothetical protein BMR11_14150 [Methylococcaceae bacterium CS5]TXK95148.1 hypothetical protein BMR02_13100 [Methylococcaceae bacterium HT1]TXK95868.1 hypothetical protein BMR10_09230 [Methylococcaceae bacterium CS4]TXL04247.1 hypothetical protein BMR07_12910 [Methylococcaceae bacterium CS1]TXL05255.1 hypothetical protein BMR09_10515 [Methylococcaceae bacterium CS3]TXL09426.1 hypothetical protein BMR08_13385 [